MPATIKKEENPVWIALGSNIGNGLQQLTAAWQRLGEFAEIKLEVISSPWRTSPVDMESENWFTNAVGCLQVTLTAQELLTVLQHVEKEFGRKRSSKSGYQDRTLDLDILYYGKNGESIIQSDTLTIPHPKRCTRLFVLKPLQEIESNFFDIEKKSYIADIISDIKKNNTAGEQTISKSKW